MVKQAAPKENPPGDVLRLGRVGSHSVKCTHPGQKPTVASIRPLVHRVVRVGSEERAPPAGAGGEKPLLRDLLGLIDRGMDDKVMLSVERMLAERACERIIVDFIHRLASILREGPSDC
nr:hypothetical protein [Streptomyces antibioticus]